MIGTLVVVGLVALFVIVFAAAAVVIVRQAEAMIIERLGKYHRTLTSGIHVIWPIIDKPRTIRWRYAAKTVEGRDIVERREVRRIDLREAVYDFPRQNVITKDNVVTEINALLYFQVTDPKKVVYEIANLPDAIEKLTQTTLRNVIGQLDLDETLTSRDTINSSLRAILDEATDKWGVKVNRVELQDINPPPAIREAMEKQMRAERERRAAILGAEGTKRANILEAEGFREAQVHKADGERRAKILVADGEAKARIRVAEAEAKAIELVTQAIAEGKGDPPNYLIAVKYIEALKEMVSGKNNKVVYLPYEASALLSSIGGVRDMLEGIKAAPRDHGSSQRLRRSPASDIAREDAGRDDEDLLEDIFDA